MDQLPPRLNVPDHLARCLMIAVLFPFTGWLAVRHSLRVNHRLAAGDLAGANLERRRARRWLHISTAALLLVLLAVITVSLWSAFQSPDRGR